GSVTRALDQQRTATGIVSAITSEQMARSPDGDAAAAMQRVSGVTVQDGKFVFVRGLGERYTTTSLNGARIPSPEPERKTVPLDLFPSGLLQTITTSKTFTPDQPGDFSGAQVNIETREFPTRRQVTFSLGAGFNTTVTGKSVPTAPTVGREWLGLPGAARQLPAIVEQAGNFEPPPPQTEVNQIINAFRNVWSPRAENGTANGSLGFSLGGTDPLFGKDVAYLASLTYSRSQDVRVDQVRAQAQPDGNGGTEEINRYEGTSGSIGVLWGGLLQMSSLLTQSSRLVLNATYSRTAENEARVESGFSENFAVPFDISRLRFVERNIFSTQLKGEHEIRRGHRFEWLATASGVNRNEPDRSELVYFRPLDPVTDQEQPAEWLSASNEGAVRTFGDLTERSFEGGANYRIEFGPHALKFGGVVRQTDRDATSRVYSISGNLPVADRRPRPEEIFDGRHSQGSDNTMRVTPLFQGGSYAAADRLAAGYGMLDLALASRIRMIAGARFESSNLDLEAQPTVGPLFTKNITYDDVLPAVSLDVALTGNMNLRLSGSQTLARPEYREIAGIMYREVIDTENVVGNPDLARTRIRNADLRWEWYPNPGEAVSVALFGKTFRDPIERVFLSTSGTLIATFVNAEGASNYGVEFELRKRLGTLSAALEPWTVFANATLMESKITIGEGAASRTNGERTMVGQAPYVVNAGLTYADDTGATSATLLYNVVGKRIVTAAEVPLPDVYELPRNVLDISLRMALTSALSARLDLKNLLDEPFEHRQGSVSREFYRVGRTFSVGLSFRN
ncbi:MAG: TonB-dependent receptor domain-containing protein, partial [Longimicrobiales bacterium]